MFRKHSAPAPVAASGRGGIEIRDVSMVLGTGDRVHVLDRISFDLPRGKFCCLVGQSGCGKSTLLGMLAGFLSPTKGMIRIGGESPESRTLRRAVVFQEYALFPWRTAHGNVRFALESRGVPKKEWGSAQDYLALVGLADSGHAYPHELSGGMQQRVAIARALASDPEFLLMDEPFGALDALTRDQLQVLVGDLWQKQNQTVVYVTHNVPEAVYLADEIVVLGAKPARIQEVITVELPRPRDPSSREFAEVQAHVTDVIMHGPGRTRPSEATDCHDVGAADSKCP